jgi:hypothetical protein
MKAVAAIAIALLLLAGEVPSFADDGSGHVSHTNTGFIASVIEQQPGSGTSAVVGQGDPDPIVATFTDPMCMTGGLETCAETATCDNGDQMVYTTYITASGVVLSGGNNCPDEPTAASQPVLTPGLVAAAFRRVDLPEAELIVQPPGGRTLVNFETNFYTERDEFTRTVTLLGRQVTLRIWPAEFGWRFGDGHETWTTSAGSAYPKLEITHRYLQTGRVAPSVATTYAAEFRVGSGPWRDVSGTVTIPGTPEGLRVVEARPVLVGGS